MTDEEYEKLKPGDKVKLTEMCSEHCPDCKILLEAQRFNRGVLVVSFVIGKLGFRTVYVENVADIFLPYENLEKYEEPNLSWSYERDY
jgi:hypothetical protein